MYTKVLIADPIVLNNRDPQTYTSTRTPREIVEQMGGIFVDGPIPEDATYPEGKTVFSYQPIMTPAQITEAVGDGQFDGVIVAAKVVKPKEGKEKIDGKPFVKFAVRIGAGTNNVEEVGKAGGVVMNTPGFNSRPTAEAIVYALYNVLSPDQKSEPNSNDPTDLYAQTSDVLTGDPRANANNLSAYYHGGWPEFQGTKPARMKIAIIGAGHIGALAGEALKADGHEVVTYSRSNTKQAANPVEAARGADVIIVQTPLTDATRGIINKEVIAAANPGVVIVNAARGEVVNVNDLKAAMRSGQVGSIIVDVDYFPDRPSPMQPYIDMVRELVRGADKRDILTPHTFADTHSTSREAGAIQAIFQMIYAINKMADDPYINHVNSGDTPTCVQDGLKPDSLNPKVRSAIQGTKGLSETREEASRFGIAGRPVC